MAKKKHNGSLKQDTEAAPPELPLGVKFLRTLRGHTGYVERIAWSPDGRTLASSSADKTIRLWDVESGECLHMFQGHKKAVKSVALNCLTIRRK